MSGVVLSNRFCEKEGYLAKMAGNYAGFMQELAQERQYVAEGILTPEDAVDRIKGGGELSKSTEAQLRACLGRIASGECPLYQEQSQQSDPPSQQTWSEEPSSTDEVLFSANSPLVRGVWLATEKLPRLPALPLRMPVTAVIEQAYLDGDDHTVRKMLAFSAGMQER